jgi:hypothetical protein
MIRERAINFIVKRLPLKLIRVFLSALERRQDLAESAGYHVYPRIYISPLPLKEEIDLTLLQQRRELAGIKLNEECALELIERLSRYAAELDPIP